MSLSLKDADILPTTCQKSSSKSEESIEVFVKKCSTNRAKQRVHLEATMTLSTFDRNESKYQKTLPQSQNAINLPPFRYFCNNSSLT